MRARVLLPLSLGLNLLLAGAVAFLMSERMQRENAPQEAQVELPSTTKIKTNVVIRRKGFQWPEIESTNYPVFIRNLRLIGCPERTIRDIIVADVNDLFAKRIRNEVVVPEQEWWKAEPNRGPLASAANQIQALETEKGRMLDQLLGPEWRSNAVMDASGLSAELFRLDGPVLSKLPPATKASLLRIEESSRKALDNYYAQTRAAGKSPDPSALARMRQQVRNDLATLLTPRQLEEYLLRYSDNSERLRQELQGFDADADEYRRIFRARDSYDLQLAALDANDPADARRRSELERMRDDAVAQAIGPERFQFYQLAHDPSFAEAKESARQNGIPAEKVLPIFEVNKATVEEVSRIQGDPGLTAAEKAVAIQEALNQKTATINTIIQATQ